MENGNTAQEALAGSDQVAALQRMLAEMQERIDSLEGRSVIPVQFSGDVPAYKLNSPCFLEDDTLHLEGETIEYTGTPNLEMVPLNAAAKKRMKEFVEALTDGQNAYYQTVGRVAPKNLITDNGTILAQRMADERHAPGKVAFVIPQDHGDVPQMPNLPDAVAKRRGRPPNKASVVVSSAAPEKPISKIMPTPVLATGTR